MMARLSHVAVDLTPLRTSRPFRRLYFGQAVSMVGSAVTTVAVPYQLYQLTHSTVALALLAASALVPLLTASFVGGAVADAVDRRKLLLAAEAGLLVVSVALLANSLLDDPKLWVLYAAEIAGVACYGFARPAMDATVPRLVGDDQIVQAISVQSVYESLAHVAGPAVGGVLIAAIGLPGTYMVDVASFAASLVAIWLLPPVPPSHEAQRASLRSIVDGFRLVAREKALLGIFLVDTNAMIFGMPSALFPPLAEHFGGGSQTLGLLYAAPNAGALLCSVLSGWIAHVRRQGLGVCVAAGLWGAAIAVFGLVDSLPVALVFLAIAGGADFVSAVLRSAILIGVTPDHMRGRLSGIELAQVASAPTLGNVEAGLLASVTSVRVSIASGGVLCVAGTILIALALPTLIRYERREAPA